MSCSGRAESADLGGGRVPAPRSMLRLPQLQVTPRISTVPVKRSMLRVPQLQVTVRISSVMAVRSMLRVTQLQVAPWISIVTVKRSMVTAARSILRLAHPGGDIDDPANFHCKLPLKSGQ